MRKSLGVYYSLSEFKTESDFAKFDFPLHDIFLLKPSSSKRMHWGRGWSQFVPTQVFSMWFPQLVGLDEVIFLWGLVYFDIF